MIKKIITLVLTVAVLITSLVVPSNAATSANAKEIKVLIVGTQHVSMVGSSIGTGLSKIAALKGKKITATVFTDNRFTGAGMNGLDFLWDLQGAKISKMLTSDYFDYIILENWLYSIDDAASFSPTTEAEVMAKYRAGTKKWVDFANSKGIQPILYISPQFLPEATDHRYEDYIKRHMTIAEEFKLPVVNAAKAAFDYKNDPTYVTENNQFSITHQDKWHPNYIGSLFAGMQLYSALYNENANDIPFAKIDPGRSVSTSSDPIYATMSTADRQTAFTKMFEYSWGAYIEDYATKYSVTKYDIPNTVAPAKNFTVKVGRKTVKNVKWTYNDEYDAYSLNVLPIMKKLGYKYKVKKNKKKKPAEIVFTKKKKKTITLNIGKKKFTVGNKKYNLPVSVKYKNKAAMVPIKAFGKGIGYKKYNFENVKKKILQLK